jgi:hypothetical protein
VDFFTQMLVLGGSQLLGGLLEADAAEEAAGIQAGASQAGIAEQRRQFDELQRMLAPYRQAGEVALGRLAPYITGGERAYEQQAALAGLSGPEAQRAAVEAISGSPGFQESVRQGEEALLSRASATGGLAGRQHPSGARSVSAADAGASDQPGLRAVWRACWHGAGVDAEPCGRRAECSGPDWAGRPRHGKQHRQPAGSARRSAGGRRAGRCGSVCAVGGAAGATGGAESWHGRVVVWWGRQISPRIQRHEHWPWVKSRHGRRAILKVQSWSNPSSTPSKLPARLSRW